MPLLRRSSLWGLAERQLLPQGGLAGRGMTTRKDARPATAAGPPAPDRDRRRRPPAEDGRTAEEKSSGKAIEGVQGEASVSKDTSMHSLDDTIAAIASPPGGAARGIVRLSGPGCVALPGRLLSPHAYGRLGVDCASPRPCPASAGSAALPHAAARRTVSWPGKRSYTGQPVAEIHTLGSPPLLEALLRTVCAPGRGRPSPANSRYGPFWPAAST